MKYEESSDIATLLVEPTDEKASLVRWVSNQSKPVVVVLPEHAAIRRPGDLLELKRASSHQHGSVTLVIAGNEPLRSWARRQGFSVYSSPESCAKALVQRRMTQPLLKQQTAPQAVSVPAGAHVSSQSYPLLRDTEPLIVMGPRLATRKKWRGMLLLVLITLLVLGILGGVGFGYLLSVAHSVRPASPVSHIHLLVFSMWSETSLLI